MGNNILSARFQDQIPSKRVYGTPEQLRHQCTDAILSTKHQEVVERGGRFFNDVVNRNGVFGARPSRFYTSHDFPGRILDYEHRPSKEEVAASIARLMEMNTVLIEREPSRTDYWWVPRPSLISIAIKAAFPPKG